MDTTDARKPGDRLRNISMGYAEAADERMWDIGCYWVLFCLDLSFAKGDSWRLRRPRGTAVMSCHRCLCCGPSAPALARQSVSRVVSWSAPARRTIDTAAAA